MKDFIGVKIALLTPDDKLVVYLRDNKPGLRYAGLWDFPGGGREGSETPEQCVIREVAEEFAIHLKENSIIYTKALPAMHDPNVQAYFMVAKVTEKDVNNIVFGDEGQRWKLISLEEFMKSTEVVDPLKDRLRGYLGSLK